MNRLVFCLICLAALFTVGCAGTQDSETLLITGNDYEIHERQRWLAWHADWRGVPHRLGGNNRNGIDCSAYVRRAYQELYRIDLPRTARKQRLQGRSIKYSELKTGDLVFFRQKSYPHHVGVFLGDGSFLHVSSKKGVTRSRLDSGYWHKYFSQGRRITQ